MKTNKQNLKRLYLLLGIMCCTLASTASTTIYLKFFIEGYWDGASAMVPVRANQFCQPPNGSTVAAEVSVELHSAIVPYALIATSFETLLTNGTCTATFASSFVGSYFIAIKHCNIIETWSAAPVNLSTLTSLAPYDFSNSLAKAYDDNLIDGVPSMKQISTVPVRYAFFSGDLDQDGNIGLADLVQIQNDINNFSFGCLCTDINGDGNCDILDTPIPETNFFQWMKRPY